MVIRSILKFFFGCLVFAVVAALVLGIAGFLILKSLDPNIFRVELEKYLTQKTGFRIELGKLQFEPGAQTRLTVEMLKCYNPQSLEKLLQSDMITAELDLTSLLRKRFWMPTVKIQNPEVFLRRRSEGAWNWQREAKSETSLPPDQAGSQSGTNGDSGGKVAPDGKLVSIPGGTPKIPISWEFGLGRLDVDDGTIHYVDETIQPSFALDIVKCDVEVLSNAALSAIRFVVNASVYNVVERKIELEGNWDFVSAMVEFNGNYDKDRASMKGLLKLVGSVPKLEGTLQVRDLDLEGVIPETHKTREYMSGILNTDLRLTCEVGNPDTIFRSLTGAGSLRVENGAVRNRNIVKEVMEKIPVVTPSVQPGTDLPPEIGDLMNNSHTEFQKVTVNFSVDHGKTTLQEFFLIHPNYQLNGQGDYGLLDKHINLDGMLVFSRSLSELFVKRVREIGFLRDRNGLLAVPFSYGGVLPDATVLPDLQYIGNKVLQGGAQELITKGLEKLSQILEPIRQAPQEPVQKTNLASGKKGEKE